MAKPRFTTQLVERAISLYRRGFTLTEIGEKMGFKRDSVAYRLRPYLKKSTTNLR